MKARKTLKYLKVAVSPFLLVSVLTGFLVACGGEDIDLVDYDYGHDTLADQTSADRALCDSLEGLSFYTATLEPWLLEVPGPPAHHWEVTFEDEGQLSMSYPELGESLSYSCTDGQVFLQHGSDAPVEIEFNSDFSEFYYQQPLADGDALYVRAPESAEHCNLENTSYSLATANISQLQFLNWYEVNIVEGSESYTASYDQDFGKIHIHTDAQDDDPMVLSCLNNEDLDALSLSKDGQELIYYRDNVGCTREYIPVCGAQRTGIQCVTTPCPTEVYKTYGNLCTMSADGSRFLFSGECGSVEGLAVEDGVACTREYNPVCGVELQVEPCLAMPCPSPVYKSYANPCVAQAAGATFIEEGTCGDKEGSVQTSIDGMACIALYDPVCAKDEAPNIACVTAPCPTHQYRTMGNSCNAGGARAEIVHSGECGSLNDALSFEHPPIRLHSINEDFPETEARVVDASIDADVLTVSLEYGGCEAHHFDLLISGAFLESNPVQVTMAFVDQQPSDCEALIQSEHKYDLLPLKHHYQDTYQTVSGSIILSGVLYTF